jgi:hypothetical protein
MFPRHLLPVLRQKLFGGKALILLGARQTGKTTLVWQLFDGISETKLYLNADEAIVRQELEDAPLDRLRRIVGPARVVVIDEAQRVLNIGLTLKLLIDQFPNVQVIATGSSSFELSNEVNEPLTGRKWEYQLFPVSWAEWRQSVPYLEARGGLESRLLFGMYPDVLNHPGEEREVLRNLASSYLYKDLLAYKGLRKPDLLEKLLRALALQVGSEVSFNELSNLLQVDKQTVATYVDLLEKAFVVFKLPPFSRNLRNEISTSRKVYFYDNGIRNAILGNFSPLSTRADVGALWENFVVSERLKVNHYAGRWVQPYFWRTRAQQEIDYVEESDGQLAAFEFKWNPNARVRFPRTFAETYPVVSQNAVTPDSMEDFLGVGGT